MEQIKHECGIAMIRLLKPLDYFRCKYGTWMYPLNKLYLMLEKQHNRGQEGAGIACVKLNTPPGEEYMFRGRASGANAITELFVNNIQKNLANFSAQQIVDANFAKSKIPFAGELYLGHLRYSTTGKSGLQYIHPFLRRNNWKAKNLCLCGNFNMTNIEEMFAKITSQGQCPRVYSDSYIMLELMGHRLDREVERNFALAKAKGLRDLEITKYIEDNIEVSNVLKTTMFDFDGGYVISGIIGSGEMFIVRDPWAIRPAFYYINEEIVVAASERPVLQTTFDVGCDAIMELKAGQALLINKYGKYSVEQILAPKGNYACSFERIYFSRGSDRDIYKERRMLGFQLTPTILKAVDYDTEHTVLSFIPNTAEVAYYGLLTGFKRFINAEKIKAIERLDHKPTHKELEDIMHQYARSEKVAWKDIKLRTFITEGNSRNDLASHVYDITYDVIEPYKDNLVIIDDSIVRGTTLKESIIKILVRLHPKKIIIVSSSPQIRYPDYYGIDMPCLEELIAFRACIQLLKEHGMHSLIESTYKACLAEQEKPREQMICKVRDVYKPFTAEQLNEKMAEMLRPEGVNIPIVLIFQSIEGLHSAIPEHKGDWYFTGNYPTSGGIMQANRAFINYVENIYQYEEKF